MPAKYFARSGRCAEGCIAPIRAHYWNRTYP